MIARLSDIRGPREQKAIQKHVKRGCHFAFTLIVAASSLTLSQSDMAIAYADIAASAQKIMDVIGSCSPSFTNIESSGREPRLREVSLKEVLPAHTYEQLDVAIRSRLASIVQRHTKSLRERFLQRYWQMAQRHHSMSQYGLSDIEVEADLIRIHEVRYERFLNNMRDMLTRLLTRAANTTSDRNTRGGFGDVSPPHVTQANKFSKPSESSKQHSTTPNPPSQQK